MNKRFTAVSLFTGAGGMDVGFERAGIRSVFANELMKEAADTYNANHPAGVMVNDDIYNVLPSLDKRGILPSQFSYSLPHILLCVRSLASLMVSQVRSVSSIAQTRPFL